MIVIASTGSVDSANDAVAASSHTPILYVVLLRIDHDINLAAVEEHVAANASLHRVEIR